MRELLRVVYDRLGEIAPGNIVGSRDPNQRLASLRDAIADVLNEGLLDGRMTDLDMRQLPPAL